jgi:hypothetical protein
VQNTTRTLLILLVLAVGGVTSLAFLAYRYTRLVENGATFRGETARRVEAFIAVREAMCEEIDSWPGGSPRPAALILVRDRALLLHGLGTVAYAETRESYRSWLEGRLRAGTPMASALEGRRDDLGRVDLGSYERLDS